MKKNEDFFRKVFEVTLQIPEGRVTTYGAIARYIGTSNSARMVGWALNSSHHNEDFIPAHRVVNRMGYLSGKHHFGGPDVMKDLLQSEGIQVKDDKIIDFDTRFWNPNKELI